MPHRAPPRTRGPAPLLAALRPRQWSKNLLLFAGIVFAAKLGDVDRWVDAVTAFAAYCAASSAAYLVNDVRDAEHDRLHPVKRGRPVARGDLAPRRALAAAAVLAALAFALGALLGTTAVLLLAAFAALQLAYSLGLKRVVGLDVAAIAATFVLRAAAGADAVEVRISPWLLACTALLALYLALAKRRAELLAGGAASRPVLHGYSVRGVDRLMLAAALATVALYSVYALTVRTPLMALTVPFVVFGLARYARLTRVAAAGEEPEQVLLTDVPMLVAVSAWIATAAVILLAA